MQRNGQLIPCEHCGVPKYYSASRVARRKQHFFCSPKCKYAAMKATESTAIVRFWSMVNKTEGCWLWTGAVLKSGYGVFNAGTGRDDKRTEYAHRFSMEIAGFPLNGNEGHHQCPNKNCVRVHPEHVLVVPRQHNPDSPSHLNRLKIRCVRGHRLPMYIPGQIRRCRLCARIRKKRRYQPPHL
jgi:hypothetical protein